MTDSRRYQQSTSSTSNSASQPRRPQPPVTKVQPKQNSSVSSSSVPTTKQAPRVVGGCAGCRRSGLQISPRKS